MTKKNYFSLFKFIFFISVFSSTFNSCSKPGDLKYFMTEEKIGKTISRKITTSNIKICFIGDTGYDVDRLTENASALYQSDCDEIHNLGDLIYDRGLKNDKDEAYDTFFYQPFKSFLNNNIPFYLTFGNHDYYGNAMVWFLKAKDEPSIKFPSSYYIVEYNFGLCIINLDTNVHFIEQIRWIKRLNNTKIFNRRCRKKIFKGHHPYISSGRHGNSEDQVKSFLTQTVRFQKTIYISGHDHIISYEGNFGDAHQFITGSFAKTQPEPLTTDAVYATKDYGFIKITIDTNWSVAPLVEIFKMTDLVNPAYSKSINL